LKCRGMPECISAVESRGKPMPIPENICRGKPDSIRALKCRGMPECISVIESRGKPMPIPENICWGKPHSIRALKCRRMPECISVIESRGKPTCISQIKNRGPAVRKTGVLNRYESLYSHRYALGGRTDGLNEMK
jgi:hypothetical protein